MVPGTVVVRDVVDHVADVVVDDGYVRREGLWLGLRLIGGRGDVEARSKVSCCLEVRSSLEGANWLARL